MCKQEANVLLIGYIDNIVILAWAEIIEEIYKILGRTL